jgi:hypothetical protein
VRGPGWSRNSEVRRLIVAATVGSVGTAAGCVAACARSMRDLQCHGARSGAIERPKGANGCERASLIGDQVHEVGCTGQAMV